MNVAEVRPDTPVVLLKGSDPALVDEALRSVTQVLRADADPSLAVEEIYAARLVDAGGAAEIGPLVDAAQTPPFLTDRRVVIGRELAGFTKADDVASLVAYLADPLPETRLVLVWEKAPGQASTGRVPKSLAEAVTAAGGVVADVGPGRKVGEWVRAQIDQSPVRLDRSAVDRLVEHLGEDASKLAGVLETIEGVYGSGAAVGVAELEPYLLAAGAVPPWALTDAIDGGDVAGALDVLGRLIHSGGRHPLAVLATLHTHFGRMMALEGAGVADERGAAEVLGLKGSTFPARKALQSVQRLGHDRLVDCMELLATADLELRGARAWPDELVMEVLVARLASRSPRGAARGRARSGSR